MISSLGVWSSWEAWALVVISGLGFWSSWEALWSLVLVSGQAEKHGHLWSSPVWVSSQAEKHGHLWSLVLVSGQAEKHGHLWLSLVLVSGQAEKHGHLWLSLVWVSGQVEKHGHLWLSLVWVSGQAEKHGHLWSLVLVSGQAEKHGHLWLSLVLVSGQAEKHGHLWLSLVWVSGQAEKHGHLWSLVLVSGQAEKHGHLWLSLVLVSGQAEKHGHLWLSLVWVSGQVEKHGHLWLSLVWVSGQAEKHEHLWSLVLVSGQAVKHGHLWLSLAWCLVKMRSMGICSHLWSWFLVKLRSMGTCSHLWSWFPSILWEDNNVYAWETAAHAYYLWYQWFLKVEFWVPYYFWYTSMTFLHYMPRTPICSCLLMMPSMWSLYWSIQTVYASKLIWITCGHGGNEVCSPKFLRDPPISSSYCIHVHGIPVTSTHLDPGVIMSADLSWTAHYYHLASMAYKTIGLLGRTFSSVDSVSAKKQLYICCKITTIVLLTGLAPTFNQGHPHAWKIQRRATKLILNTVYLTIGLSTTMMWCYAWEVLRLQHVTLTFTTWVRTCMSHCRSMSNNTPYAYFNRLPRIWNSLPPINVNLSSNTIKYNIRKSYQAMLYSPSNHILHVAFTFFVLVQTSCAPHSAIFNWIKIIKLFLFVHDQAASQLG